MVVLQALLLFLLNHGCCFSTAQHGNLRERSVTTIEGYGEAETMRFFIIVLIVVASMILLLLGLILFGVMEVTYYEYPAKQATTKSY